MSATPDTSSVTREWHRWHFLSTQCLPCMDTEIQCHLQASGWKTGHEMNISYRPLLKTRKRVISTGLQLCQCFSRVPKEREHKGPASRRPRQAGPLESRSVETTGYNRISLQMGTFPDIWVLPSVTGACRSLLVRNSAVGIFWQKSAPNKNPVYTRFEVYPFLPRVFKLSS